MCCLITHFNKSVTEQTVFIVFRHVHFLLVVLVAPCSDFLLQTIQFHTSIYIAYPSLRVL